MSHVNDLAHYHRTSRLHFIGSWTNEASGMIRHLLQEAHPEFDHSALFGEQHVVCHVDMDCFFVKVALSKPENAHLRGLPVAVASGGAHSEVSSCSYAARKFGVHASMFVSEARRRCPELQLVSYDFDRVREINAMVYRAAFELCPAHTHMKLQVISVDEFFVAFDATPRDGFDLARRYCEDLRARIELETNGCTASCGIAPNVHVARAVTNLAKPDGIKVVRADEIVPFVQAMHVDAIHGVGSKMMKRIREMLATTTTTATTTAAAAAAMTTLPLRRQRDGGEQPKKKKKRKESADDDDEQLLLDDDDDDDDDGDESEDEDQASTPPVLLGHLCAVSIDRMRRCLGNAMADKLYNLAHRGADHTLVVGTGTSDGAAVPKAVATSMNYAVRLSALHELSALLLEVCKDIESKLTRVGGAAQTLKFTLLERHPQAPVAPPKHLGCGRCIERVLASSVKSASLDVAFVSAEKIHDTLMPFALKFVSASTQSQPQQQQPPQQQEQEQQQAIPFRMEKEVSGPISIHDVRGITVNAGGIVPRKRTASKMLGADGKKQLSLTASLMNAVAAAKQKKQKNMQSSEVVDIISDDDDDNDDDLVLVSSKESPKKTQPRQQQTVVIDDAADTPGSVIFVRDDSDSRSRSRRMTAATRRTNNNNINNNNNNNMNTDVICVASQQSVGSSPSPGVVQIDVASSASASPAVVGDGGGAGGDPVADLNVVCQAIRGGTLLRLLTSRSTKDRIRRLAASVVLSESAMPVGLPLLLPAEKAAAGFSDEVIAAAKFARDL